VLAGDERDDDRDDDREDQEDDQQLDPREPAADEVVTLVSHAHQSCPEMSS
jgi:hypothetical protein